MRGVIAVLCALPVGCGPGSGDPTGTAESSTGSTTTTTTPTGSEGASTVDTNEPPPTDLPTAPVDPEAACTALCETSAACNGHPFDPGCVTTCLDGLGHGSGNEPGCIAADAALVACRAALDCEALADDSGYPSCDPELRVMLGACRLCRGSAGWVDHETCYMEDLCVEGLRRVECDDVTCVCTFEGAVTKICPGGCDPDGLPTKGFGCCP
jgi:hypothetical protein